MKDCCHGSAILYLLNPILWSILSMNNQFFGNLLWSTYVQGHIAD